MEAPGRKIIGFGSAGDLGFVVSACERYGLPDINFSVYDIATIINQVKNEKKGLVDWCAAYNVDVSKLTAHKSSDDAMMTMLLAKAFCAEQNLTMEEVLEKNKGIKLSVEKYLDASQLEQWQRERKVQDDPRITKLGHWLRTTSIDEIPQFINVFLSQMSIIGPRAITNDELEWFGKDKARLLSVPPGITGMWQTGSRNMATFESGFRQELELSYVDSACVKMDAKLFFRTFSTIIARTGK